MADLSFSNSTRSSVLRFYAEDWTCDGEEHYEILQELPNDVAAACIWDLVHYDLMQVPLFQNLRLPASPFFDRELADNDEGAKVRSRSRLRLRLLLHFASGVLWCAVLCVVCSDCMNNCCCVCVLML